MKKLFWIGSPFFSGALAACGWEVHVHNFEQTAVFGWGDIVSLAGWEPDVVVVADKSRPPFVLGMEKFPCLTVFYCVDSHIHSWYPLYAQGFDVCLMSLKDHLPRMAGEFLPAERIWWFPAFAKNEDQPMPYAPEWDLLFVGTVNAQTTPKRHQFMQELKERIPSLHVTRGNYRQLYPKARLVLNFCEFDDLNFRVFEALGCGACLVTPEIENGQPELFTHGEDLLTYPVHTEDSMDILVATVQEALQDETRCRRIAASGHAKVDARHRAVHRAEAFTQAVHELAAGELIKKRTQRASVIRAGALRFIYLLLAESVDSPLLKQSYLKAAG
ncbi:glycosyltransferase [Desulfovibrio mangrovi]|uniref:glycosyltransferase family protein n=1 Tax=Desulfovibrio mangrovi TaxID=2976983 RepID=UPI00224752A2|nr:glycosyltransferase [Desulfovibrio mangrovi]UZP68568.1 glycosyltransferase [Desulfovibrio mangrovi]